MIFERLKTLCKDNGTTPTALCFKITGSKGNLPTWKKGNIRSDYLIAISNEFNVATDFILCKTNDPTPPKKEPLPEVEVVQRINQALVDKGWKLPDGRMSDDQLNTIISFISDNADMLRKVVEQSR